MRIVTALVAGLIFGLGLSISQMIDPAKVLAFLDLFGAWDPSLAFVMLGAIPVAAIGFRYARGPEVEASAPVSLEIDRRLATGAVLFGAGWGLIGYCPGPAIAALGLGNPGTSLFIAAMLAGMLVFARTPLAAR